MMYTMDYAHDLIFARDFFLDLVGDCFDDTAILVMVDDMTHGNLQLMENDNVKNMLAKSPNFKAVWNHAIENGLKPNEELMYVYDYKKRTLADVYTMMDYVHITGCETAFAKYVIGNKKAMEVVSTRLSESELKEMVTLIGYLN